MHEETFRLDFGDRNVGSLFLPDEASTSLPVLIICHGWPSDRHLYEFPAELVARGTAAGMAVVTFDFYSSGDTGGDPSGMSDGRWASNLHDVCRWIAEQPWTDPARIVALGISSGSTAVLRCARASDVLAAAISVNTCLGHYIGMPNGPARRLVENWDHLLAGGTVELYGYPCGLDFFKDFIGGAPIYYMAEVKCPALFLEGGQDNVFRRTDGWLGHELMRRAQLSTDFIEIPEGKHGMWNVAEEATEAVLQWLRTLELVP
jgi:dienelactone hydrolase